ncbi:nucleoside hydrolase [Roseicyclus sp. F158]|uniref:Nucleoside hydrolase n=1 Tax=Tropicimonas omnivorans TaxID=3075590 RepID=A0ABU3DHM7_9RHOB|nr:nucleoside hydrolase [Roseicyclus sp. F158]MDT0683214.1 nucleoside hydrolase [Roseicyclus sp. F158]
MTSFPDLSPAFRRTRLAPPDGAPVRLVIDTDCANEIDDQFALAWALMTPERVQVEATVAEPFSFRHHLPELRRAEAGQGRPMHQAWAARLAAEGRSAASLDAELVTPDAGMEASHAEIRRIHGLCGAGETPALRGAPRYMTGPDDIVWSEGAEALVELALAGEGPLYVAAMGCLTNVAAALARAPEIAARIVVLWTAGFPSRQPHDQWPALNLVQDPHAARLLFGCGVPLVYLPGYHVGAQLRISRPEMELFVKGRGALGDALWKLYDQNPLHRMFATADTARRTWVIWDMIDIAWLVDPAWVPTILTPSPVLGEDLRFSQEQGRHEIREAYDIARDDIFGHFYDKLAAFA